MNKINVELDTETYKNIHLLLHNLIELTDSYSKGVSYPAEQYQSVLKNINEPLKSIKTALECKK